MTPPATPGHAVAPPDAADDLARTFPGPSELAARCRALDWARTPLGPVAGWPPALRAVARTCLESPFPVNLWCGPELVLVYNDGYRRLLGDKHPHALGRPGREVWAEIWEGIAPMFASIAAGGPPAFAEDQPFVVERFGEREDVWFTYSLSPVRDDDGRIVAYLNVVAETTERMRLQHEADAARAAAERAETRLREAFAQAPVAVCVLRGPEHRYELVNPRYQRFFPGRRLEGLEIADALPELADQGVYELLDRVRATGEPYVANEYVIQVDRAGHGVAEEAVFNFVFQPVRDAGGAVDGIVAVAVDVTELVQARRAADAARAEAEAANRAKSEFLTMMSHELRTPLNAIGGYAQLLELGVHGPVSREQAGALARIQASQHHLLGLINAVLNYARLEAGRVHYDLADVDVAGALAEVEALMAVQAGTRGVTLAFAPPPAADGAGAALRVRADAEKLRQVLLNLLSNAVKFTDRGGAITVAASVHAGTVRIAVADTGRGIPPEQLERIFEPFVQVGRTFSSADAGTGLGLAISRDLARGMGGELTATSEVGVGSTFTLALPRGG